MGKPEKKSIFESIFLFFRRCLIFLIIMAVASLAIFWESLPVTVKNAVTSLSSNQSVENDDLVPVRFRAEKNAENMGNISRQTPQLAQTANSSYPFDKEPVNTGVAIRAEINNSPRTDDLLVELHARLQQMGATSCQLTYWGDKGNMYRFSCQIPVSEHSPNATRTFQSIAPDAAQSMQEVVDQIKQWQLPQ